MSLTCKLRDHDYILVQEFSSWRRRIACPRCGKSWVMIDTRQEIVEWDNDCRRLEEENFGNRVLPLPWLLA